MHFRARRRIASSTVTAAIFSGLMIVALAPAFAARPALTALCVAAALSYAERAIGGAALETVPGWLGALLFVGAVMEHLLLWRARDWLDDLPSWVRAAVKAAAAVVTLVALKNDRFVELPEAGWVFSAALLAVATWLFARAWSTARGLILTVDPGGALRIRYAVDLAEIFFTVGGVALVALNSRIALFFLGASVVAAAFFAAVAYAWERSAEVPCAHCGKQVHACALLCPSCSNARGDARRANWTGRPSRAPIRSAEHQRMSLTAAGRCASCASPGRPRNLLAPCARCGAKYDAEAAKQFLRAIDKRLPVTLAVCAAFSAVPVFGLVVGLLFFALSRNGSLRRYAPWQSRFVARLLVSGATVLLALLQPIPILGIVSLPAICALNYVVDRSAIRLTLRSNAVDAAAG